MRTGSANIYFRCLKLSCQCPADTNVFVKAVAPDTAPFFSYCIDMLYKAVSITLPNASAGALITPDVRLRAAVATCETKPPLRMFSIRNATLCMFLWASIVASWARCLALLIGLAFAICEKRFSTLPASEPEPRTARV